MRRFLKKMGYSWKRFRKSLKSKQSPIKYNSILKELMQLIDLDKKGEVDLFFGDSSGFNLEGYVPYGWQPKNEYIEITPSKSKSVQIFGIMNLDNRLESYLVQGSQNSEIIIAFIDDFVKKISKKTYLVLDNASIHHSNLFKAQLKRWKNLNLEIFYLPTYSPHLNPIEILWRKAKYDWLKYEKINTMEMLKQEVENIFKNFGSQFKINFSQDILRKNKVSGLYA